MDKLSLYEFLSFFLPGALFCFFAYQIVPEGLLVFRSMGDAGDVFIFFTISLMMGLGLHRLNFLFLERRWFKKLIYTSVTDMLKRPPKGVYLANIRQWLDEGDCVAEELFDSAYYQLEVEGRLESAKAFQSTYFFLRNSFVGLVLLIPGYVFVFWKSHGAMTACFILLLGIVMGIVIRNLALFYRGKMVQRLFNLFFHQKR